MELDYKSGLKRRFTWNELVNEVVNDPHKIQFPRRRQYDQFYQSNWYTAFLRNALAQNDRQAAARNRAAQNPGGALPPAHAEPMRFHIATPPPPGPLQISDFIIPPQPIPQSGDPLAVGLQSEGFMTPGLFEYPMPTDEQALQGLDEDQDDDPGASSSAGPGVLRRAGRIVGGTAALGVGAAMAGGRAAMATIDGAFDVASGVLEGVEYIASFSSWDPTNPNGGWGYGSAFSPPGSPSPAADLVSPAPVRVTPKRFKSQAEMLDEQVRRSPALSEASTVDYTELPISTPSPSPGASSSSAAAAGPRNHRPHRQRNTASTRNHRPR
jgi:hypothetical protein